MVEQPVRASGLLDQHRRIVIASGLAISVVSALVLIPKVVNPAIAAPTAVQGSLTTGFTPVPAGLDWQDARKAVRFVACLNRSLAGCTIVHGTGQSILLIGDSHAAMLMPTFTKIAHQDHLTLFVTTNPLCPWQQNLYASAVDYANFVKLFGLSPQHCKGVQDDLYTRVIPSLHPDVIVAMDDDDVYTNPETATVRSVRQLSRAGRKIILVENTPTAPFDPLSCLSRAKVLEQCRYIANSSPTPLTLLYRRLENEHSGVYSADFDHLVCPYFPICDPVVNGQIVKTDQSHLTAAFAESIAPEVDAYLRQTAIRTTP